MFLQTPAGAVLLVFLFSSSRRKERASCCCRVAEVTEGSLPAEKRSVARFGRGGIIVYPVVANDRGLVWLLPLRFSLACDE